MTTESSRARFGIRKHSAALSQHKAGRIWRSFPRKLRAASMGGSESLLTGPNDLDKFSWIGAFSAGGIPDDFQKDFPALDAKANQQLHLLWIACGTEDRSIKVNRDLREWLKTKGAKVTEIETPAMHTWMVWRRNLAEFAPLLFR
jgi:enterochelin esterase-like enzyme